MSSDITAKHKNDGGFPNMYCSIDSIISSSSQSTPKQTGKGVRKNTMSSDITAKHKNDGGFPHMYCSIDSLISSSSQSTPKQTGKVVPQNEVHQTGIKLNDWESARKVKVTVNYAHQSDWDRIIHLARKAWSCYVKHEYMMTLKHYDDILEVTGNSTERISRCQRVNAYVMFRRGMCYEWLGDLTRSMDSYCDALKLYRDSNQGQISDNESEMSTLPSAAADEVDEKVGTIVRQMANVQLKLGKVQRANRLYTIGSKILRDVEKRHTAKIGHGTSVKLKRQMVELLHNIHEKRIERGEYEAAEQAHVDTLKLQKLLASIPNSDQCLKLSRLTERDTFSSTVQSDEEVILRIFREELALDSIETDSTTDEESLLELIEGPEAIGNAKMTQASHNQNPGEYSANGPNDGKHKSSGGRNETGFQGEHAVTNQHYDLDHVVADDDDISALTMEASGGCLFFLTPAFFLSRRGEVGWW